MPVLSPLQLSMLQYTSAKVVSTLPMLLSKALKLSAIFLKGSCPAGWFRLLRSDPHQGTSKCCSELSHQHLIALFKSTLKLAGNELPIKTCRVNDVLIWTKFATELVFSPTCYSAAFPKMALPASLLSSPLASGRQSSFIHQITDI